MLDSAEPRSNFLLAALPDPEWHRWRHLLEKVEMPLGQVLYEAGATLAHVYFPTTSIVSLLYVMESGASAEIAVVGNEGLVGVSLFMGGESTPSRAVRTDKNTIDSRILQAIRSARDNLYASPLTLTFKWPAGSSHLSGATAARPMARTVLETRSPLTEARSSQIARSPRAIRHTHVSWHRPEADHAPRRECLRWRQLSEHSPRPMKAHAINVG
jgi:hypothetical protein